MDRLIARMTEGCAFIVAAFLAAFAVPVQSGGGYRKYVRRTAGRLCGKADISAETDGRRAKCERIAADAENSSPETSDGGGVESDRRILSLVVDNADHAASPASTAGGQNARARRRA